MMAAKTDEEREFYLVLSAKHKYSKRELERQIDSALFERTMMSEITNKLIVERNEGLTALRDSYVLEFYLEALDRDVKKADENPSVGLILCTKKDATFDRNTGTIQNAHTLPQV
jgi:predicted nuclease of restriction endonuclease-like (RecB) superfamily